MSNVDEQGYAAPINDELNEALSVKSEDEIEIQLRGGRTVNVERFHDRIPPLEDTEPIESSQDKSGNIQIYQEKDYPTGTKSAESDGKLPEFNAYLEDQWKQHREIENLKAHRDALEQELYERNLAIKSERDQKDRCEAHVKNLKLESDVKERLYKRDIAALSEKIHELEQRPQSTSTTRLTVPKMYSTVLGVTGLTGGKEQPSQIDPCPWNAPNTGQQTPQHNPYLGSGVDVLLTPKFFSGNEDYHEWLETFMTFSKLKSMDAGHIVNCFPLFLTGAAKMWHQGLPEAIKTSKDELIEAFKLHYAPTRSTAWRQQAELWERKMQASETVRDYITTMKKMAAKINADELTTMGAIMKGLRSGLRTIIIPLNPTNLEELEETAKRAEDAMLNDNNATDDVLNAIKDIHKKLESVTASQIVPQQSQTEQKEKESILAVVRQIAQENKNSNSVRPPQNQNLYNNGNRPVNRSWNNWNQNNTPTRFPSQSFIPRARSPFRQGPQAFRPPSQTRQSWQAEGNRGSPRGNWGSTRENWGEPNRNWGASRFQKYAPRRSVATNGCYVCGNPNHYARNCDQLTQTQRSSQSFPRSRQNLAFNQQQ